MDVFRRLFFNKSVPTVRLSHASSASDKRIACDRRSSLRTSRADRSLSKGGGDIRLDRVSPQLDFRQAGFAPGGVSEDDFELLDFRPSVAKIGRGPHEILLVENSNCLFHVEPLPPQHNCLSNTTYGNRCVAICVPVHNMSKKRYAAIPQRNLH